MSAEQSLPGVLECRLSLGTLIVRLVTATLPLLDEKDNHALVACQNGELHRYNVVCTFRYSYSFMFVMDCL